MATTDVAQLLVRVNASTELLRRNLLDAERAVAGFQRDTDQKLSLIDRKFAALSEGFSSAKVAASGLIALAGGSALIGAAERALDYASSLGETAQQLGVTTRDLQVYRYAASQVGVEQEAMDRGLAKLTLTLGKAAAGAKEPTKALADLGISLGDIEGKSAGQVLPLIAEGLSKIEEPAKRARIEVALFGKLGQQLDVLLSGGRKGIDEMAASAERLGIVLDDKLIQQADDAADKVATLKQVLETKLASAVAENAAEISNFVDQILRIADAIPQAIRWLNQLKLRVEIAQDSIAQYTLGRPEDRAAAAARLVRSKGALAQSQSAEVTDELERRFPLANVLPVKRAPPVDPDGVTGGGSTKKPRSAGGGRPARVAAAETTADRSRRITASLETEYGDSSRQISVGLSAAGADANALKVDLGDINDLVGGLSTGLEGVDIGSILTEDEQRRLESFVGTFRDDLTHGLADAVVYGGDVGDVLVNSIKRAAAELLSSGLLDLLSGNKFGSSFGKGGIGTALGSLFGGKYAGGGDPPMGKVSLVGERGPELFVPKTPGTIIPNHMLGGRSGAAAVPARVIVDVQPSPLFVTTVAAGGRAAGQEGARSVIASATRPRLGRSAGAP